MDMMTMYMLTRLDALHVSHVLSGQRMSRRVVEVAREAGVVSQEARQ